MFFLPGRMRILIFSENAFFSKTDTDLHFLKGRIRIYISYLKTTTR